MGYETFDDAFESAMRDLDRWEVHWVFTPWNPNDPYEKFCLTDDELIDIHETDRIFSLFGIKYKKDKI